jgi:hypothetical protein
MNFLHLLHQRATLLRQARLANLAFAYHRLGDFSARIARARLHGTVQFSLADPATDRHWPTLTAHEGNQSVIEEHFTDEDLVELGDLLVFLREDAHTTEFTFRLEDFDQRFRAPLGPELAQAGVDVATEPASENSPPPPR